MHPHFVASLYEGMNFAPTHMETHGVWKTTYSLTHRLQFSLINMLLIHLVLVCVCEGE